MNPQTLQRHNKSMVPVLYMAMELSNRNWMLLFGDGARRCQLSIAAGEILSCRRDHGSVGVTAEASPQLARIFSA